MSKQLNSKISKGITNYICYGIIGSCLHVFSELYGVTLCTAGILAKQLWATLTLVRTMYLTETPQKWPHTLSNHFDIIANYMRGLGIHCTEVMCTFKHKFTYPEVRDPFLPGALKKR